MKNNRFWMILIAVALILSCAAAVGVYLYGDTGNTVTISYQGKVVDTIHLDTVTTPYSFTLETESGGYNTIQVEQGRICVSDASCPDHVCVNTGWLSGGIVPIVCLPNELVIQIKNTAPDLDGAVQ